jgi:hypothetical protein
MSNLYRGPSKDASYQVLIHKHGCHRQFLFLIGRLKKIFYSETACPNEPKLGNRGPSKDASYQVLIHLAKQFQRRKFLKIGQSETRIACGGHVC